MSADAAVEVDGAALPGSRRSSASKNSGRTAASVFVLRLLCQVAFFTRPAFFTRLGVEAVVPILPYRQRVSEREGRVMSAAKVARILSRGVFDGLVGEMKHLAVAGGLVRDPSPSPE